LCQFSEIGRNILIAYYLGKVFLTSLFVFMIVCCVDP